eukprot:1227231-Rhodomonas_salina.2
MHRRKNPSMSDKKFAEYATPVSNRRPLPFASLDVFLSAFRVRTWRFLRRVVCGCLQPMLLDSSHACDNGLRAQVPRDGLRGSVAALPGRPPLSNLSRHPASAI